MGKYDNVISEAKALISEVYIKAGNYGLIAGNLKLNSFVNRLQAMINIAEMVYRIEDNCLYCNYSVNIYF